MNVLGLIRNICLKAVQRGVLDLVTGEAAQCVFAVHCRLIEGGQWLLMGASQDHCARYFSDFRKKGVSRFVYHKSRRLQCS